ncbi:MAG: ATP-binding protein [Proteobacteria bacterium]|nr:ATP-binding protein [Pseudomonadota bacterium]
MVLSIAGRLFKFRRFQPQEERLFCQFYADKAYPKARFGIIFGFFAWISFGFWDGVGFPRLLPELAAIRFGLVAPVIGGLGWFIVCRPKRFKSAMQGFLFPAPAAAALGLFMMMTLAQGEDSNKAFQQYWPAFSALYFFAYAFLGMRLIPATIIGLAGIGLVCVAGCRSGVLNTAFGIALLQLTILNVLGMIICARMEIQERTLFRLRQHHHRLSRTAREERLNAQAARDETQLENIRAEAALMLAQSERVKLGEAIAEKERFLSAAYHDLQQPLSTIGLYARIAKNKLDKSPGMAVQPDLDVIENAAHDIALMFEDVRDAWEVGGTKPNLEAIDLYPMMDEIERELREWAGQKGLVFRVRKSPRLALWVRSDRTLLKRALSNLVGNAIRYTETGGVVLGAVPLPSSVRMDVWDTGVGIPVEFQSLIFEEYFQVRHSTADPKRGLGLGLSIVKRIEKKLSGHTLRFASKPGRGSRFSLHIPSDQEPCLELAYTFGKPPASEPNRLLAGKYIVVVEDEPTNLDGMVQTIGSAGCIVEGVDGIGTACRLFADRERCPDLLVTDFLLHQGQTGLDAVAALRERFEWAQDVPVLFVTGELDVAAKLAEFQGVFDIHYKPIDPDILLTKISILLTQ